MDDFFDQSKNSMPHIGDQAPAFRSVTTQGTIYFPADYFGKWVILFSYLTDYTPKATSEFRTFATLHDDFKALNCELIGLPIARLSSIKEKIEDNGMKEAIIKFPLIEDKSLEVARKYGMIQQDQSNTKVVRAVFFIDPECMIKTILYYPLSLDLNFVKLKLVIAALQTEDEVIFTHAGSIGVAEKRPETQKEYEWPFCTREIPKKKVMNLN
jgi:peroxiredoxin (alkyl hydroperoxide reductase subunit C)